jgi:hypothetical protein
MAYPNVPANEFLTHGVDVNANYFNVAIGAGGAVGTLSQGAGAFVTSVVETATGIYTVNLAKPYPASLLFVNPEIGTPLVGDAMVTARFDANSYSPTAGTFIINTSGNTGAADTTQIAAEPANGAILFVHYAFLNV